MKPKSMKLFLLLLLTIVTQGVWGQTEESIPTLVIGDNELTINAVDEDLDDSHKDDSSYYQLFKFVAPSDGEFDIESNFGNQYYAIFDKDKNCLGNYNTWCYIHQLTSGETYYIGIRPSDIGKKLEGTFTVVFVCKQHNCQLVERQEPTCTEDGYKEHYCCSNCGRCLYTQDGESFLKSEFVIGAKGHALGGDKCTECNYEFPVITYGTNNLTDIPHVKWNEYGKYACYRFELAEPGAISINYSADVNIYLVKSDVNGDNLLNYSKSPVGEVTEILKAGNYYFILGGAESSVSLQINPYEPADSYLGGDDTGNSIYPYTEDTRKYGFYAEATADFVLSFSKSTDNLRYKFYEACTTEPSEWSTIENQYFSVPVVKGKDYRIIFKWIDTSDAENYVRLQYANLPKINLSEETTLEGGTEWYSIIPTQTGVLSIVSDQKVGAEVNAFELPNVAAGGEVIQEVRRKVNAPKRIEGETSEVGEYLVEAGKTYNIRFSNSYEGAVVGFSMTPVVAEYSSDDSDIYIEENGYYLFTFKKADNGPLLMTSDSDFEVSASDVDSYGLYFWNVTEYGAVSLLKQDFNIWSDGEKRVLKFTVGNSVHVQEINSMTTLVSGLNKDVYVKGNSGTYYTFVATTSGNLDVSAKIKNASNVDSNFTIVITESYEEEGEVLSAPRRVVTGSLNKVEAGKKYDICINSLYTEDVTADVTISISRDLNLPEIEFDENGYAQLTIDANSSGAYLIKNPTSSLLKVYAVFPGCNIQLIDANDYEEGKEYGWSELNKIVSAPRAGNDKVLLVNNPNDDSRNIIIYKYDAPVLKDQKGETLKEKGYYIFSAPDAGNYYFSCTSGEPYDICLRGVTNINLQIDRYSSYEEGYPLHFAISLNKDEDIYFHVSYPYDDIDITMTWSKIEVDIPEELELKDSENLAETFGDLKYLSSFEVNSVTYKRNSTTSRWGTVVLPVELESNSEITYYIPTSMSDGTTENVLNLKQMDVVPANVPVFYRFNNEADSYTYEVSKIGTCLVEIPQNYTFDFDEDGNVIWGFYSWNWESDWHEFYHDLDGFCWYGVYKKEFIYNSEAYSEGDDIGIPEDAAAYPADDEEEMSCYVYLSGDQLKYAKKKLTIKPFRAYLWFRESPWGITSDGTSTGEAKTLTLSIEGENTNGIQAIMTEDGEIEDIEGIYDLNGRRLNQTQRGVNIIRRADGTTRKLIVK